jgi:hypothetical protein
VANIKCECAAVLCRLLEPAQTTEDPSSFQNSGAGQRFGSPESNGNSPLSLTSMSKSGCFTCCVPVLPTIKEIQNYTLPYIFMHYILCFYCQSIIRWCRLWNIQIWQLVHVGFTSSWTAKNTLYGLLLEREIFFTRTGG